MIENISFQFGSSPDQGPTTFDVAHINILVGPNNSGKTKTLEEISTFISSGEKNRLNKIVDEVSLKAYSKEEGEKIVQEYTVPPNSEGGQLSPGHIRTGDFTSSVIVNKEELVEALEVPNEHSVLVCQKLFQWFSINLTPDKRRQVAKQQALGDLLEPPKGLFSHLVQKPDLRASLRDILYNTFKKYLVFDITLMKKIRLRYSDKPPPDERTEIGIHQEARDFHEQAQQIKNMGDGIKAYTGLILEMVAGRRKILFIDEPELCLHPPLAQRLGKHLGENARKYNKQVFISTHSSHFLMGAIQSDCGINVIRLTYQNEIPTARVLSQDDLKTAMQDPLLRSSGVLNGLFYDGVVVVEADSDRCFYQEINERLISDKPKWGMEHCLFINAHGKDQIYRMVKLLRDFGVSAGAIYDLDILRQQEGQWGKIVDSIQFPEEYHSACFSLSKELFQKWGTIKASIPKGEKEKVRTEKLRMLLGAWRDHQDLVDKLREHGLFIVPMGELEDWLGSLEVQVGKKRDWLPQVFKKMGRDPQSEEYISPGEDDVWEFMYSIKKWLEDPGKKGIPV